MSGDRKGVRVALTQLVSSNSDSTIIDYLVGILEDEHFEFGEDASVAYEALGDFLVSGGCSPSEEAALGVCKALQAQFDTAPVSAPSMRALGTGPVVMSQAGGKDLLYKEQSFMHLIQTPFGNLPTITERDKLKIEKRNQKEEEAGRAALRAHQERAGASTKSNNPVIVRNKGSGGSKDLHLDDFNVSNGGKDLIQDATVTMAWGRRYGLIGRNGTGKTTLLRHLSTHEIKGIPENCQVLHVEQEVVGDDTPVIDAVLACDVERLTLLAEETDILRRLNIERREDPTSAANGGAAPLSVKEEVKEPVAVVSAGGKAAPAVVKGGSSAPGASEAALSARLVVVYQRLEEIDAYGAEARASTILAGLSFTAAEMRNATKTFSGGWRMRVALARALFVEPDLLLLDEPTNHLDLHAVLWLEDYLVKWPKTLLVVSHAREFLNVVCTDILHLHSQKIITYKGDYTTFERTMTERVKNARKASEAMDSKKAHIQAFIDRFRYNANRAALVQSRIKALERMVDVEVMETDPEYVFNFPIPSDTGVSAPIVGFHDVSFNYPGGPTLFKNLNFGLDLESRFAIVGPNGIGKSTLLNLISGSLEATTGQVNRNPKVRMATFSQHHVDGLDLALSPLALMLRSYPDLKEQEARSHLGSFGVSGTLALQPMYTLSGGQKSRVAFAKLTFTQPHILLLDEPSNHLDIDAVNALIEGLSMFKGGVLMVSHDQFLIEACVNELWMCEDGRVTPFHGTFQEYKSRLRLMANKA